MAAGTWAAPRFPATGVVNARRSQVCLRTVDRHWGQGRPGGVRGWPREFSSLTCTSKQRNRGELRKPAQGVAAASGSVGGPPLRSYWPPVGIVQQTPNALRQHAVPAVSHPARLCRERPPGWLPEGPAPSLDCRLHGSACLQLRT